jgi:hypothetical protein
MDGCRLPTALENKKENGQVKSLTFELHMSLFSYKLKSFFGNTWVSREARDGGDDDEREESQEVAFREAIYMLSTLQRDPNCVAVVELVALSREHSSSVPKLYACGWSMIDFNKSIGADAADDGGSDDDGSDDERSKMTRAPVYGGSCRVLFSLSDDAWKDLKSGKKKEEKNKSTKKGRSGKSGDGQAVPDAIKGCKLYYSVRKWAKLASIKHLIRDNEFVGQHDLVPGLKLVPVPSKAGNVGGDDDDDNVVNCPCLYPMASRRGDARTHPVQPSLHALMPIKLRKITVEMFKKDTFEKTMLEEFGLKRHGNAFSENESQVFSIKLHIGMHNGRKLVEGWKVLELSQNKSTNDDQLVESADNGSSSVSLQLVPSRYFAAVFFLEYTLRLAFSTGDAKTAGISSVTCYIPSFISRPLYPVHHIPPFSLPSFSSFLGRGARSKPKPKGKGGNTADTVQTEVVNVIVGSSLYLPHDGAKLRKNNKQEHAAIHPKGKSGKWRAAMASPSILIPLGNNMGWKSFGGHGYMYTPDTDGENGSSSVEGRPRPVGAIGFKLKTSGELNTPRSSRRSEPEEEGKRGVKFDDDDERDRKGGDRDGKSSDSGSEDRDKGDLSSEDDSDASKTGSDSDDGAWSEDDSDSNSDADADPSSSEEDDDLSTVESNESLDLSPRKASKGGKRRLYSSYAASDVSDDGSLPSVRLTLPPSSQFGGPAGLGDSLSVPPLPLGGGVGGMPMTLPFHGEDMLASPIGSGRLAEDFKDMIDNAPAGSLLAQTLGLAVHQPGGQFGPPATRISTDAGPIRVGEYHPEATTVVGGVPPLATELSRAAKTKLSKHGFNEALEDSGKSRGVARRKGGRERGSEKVPGALPDPMHEAADPLAVHELTFRFAAFRYLDNRFAPRPQSLYFTFQFYNCGPTRTERMLVVPSGGASSGGGGRGGQEGGEGGGNLSTLNSLSDPHVLVRDGPQAKRRHRRGHDEPSPSYKFTVDTTAVQPDEHIIFATYLRTKKMQVNAFPSFLPIPSRPFFSFFPLLSCRHLGRLSLLHQIPHPRRHHPHLHQCRRHHSSSRSSLSLPSSSSSSPSLSSSSPSSSLSSVIVVIFIATIVIVTTVVTPIIIIIPIIIPIAPIAVCRASSSPSSSSSVTIFIATVGRRHRPPPSSPVIVNHIFTTVPHICRWTCGTGTHSSTSGRWKSHSRSSCATTRPVAPLLSFLPSFLHFFQHRFLALFLYSFLEYPFLPSFLPRMPLSSFFPSFLPSFIPSFLPLSFRPPFL